MYFAELERLDALWCSDTQVPASLLSDISINPLAAKRLSLYRIACAVSVLSELMGYFLMTVGFFPSQPGWILFLGLLLMVGGGLSSAYFCNRSGIYLSLELQDYLKNMTHQGREIRSILSENGCSEWEINSIGTLPNDVYQSELNSYKRAFLMNLGTPLACSLALLINGEILIGMLVLILGILSFPIGEHFFKEHTKRNESELRLGKSAYLKTYIAKVYDEHIWLTMRVNLLSQMPILLFVFRFIWNASSNLIAIFFALSQGLAGLTGTLAFQRSRVISLRTTSTTKHLIDAISSHSFILTPKRWKEHISKLEQTSIQPLIANGTIFSNFQSKQSHSLPPLNCQISNGEIAVLQAPSGHGKSTLLLSIIHILEHTGSLFFIKNDQLEDAHSLSKSQLEQRVFFFREETVEKSARLVDLFRHPLSIHLSEFLEDMGHEFGTVLRDLAWNASDNLIEKEIDAMNTSSVFPKQMVEAIRKMRVERSAILQKMLQNAGGNLSKSSIFPERTFSTLSSGEKIRINVCLAYETSEIDRNVKLVILDEPLSHLDHQSLLDQLNMIEKIQRSSSKPSQLMISHHFLDEMNKQLKNVVFMR